MRLLDKWLDSFDDWCTQIARVILATGYDALFNEVSVPLSDCGGLDGEELNKGVHRVVCWMVETLAGLESLQLENTTEPLHTNQEIVVKVKLKKAPTVEDPQFNTISS